MHWKQVLSCSAMSDGSFLVPKTEGGGLIWFMLAFFIPWQKTSLSGSCHQLTSLLQDDLGRELLSHHLPYSLLSFWSVLLVAGRYNIFLFLPGAEQILVSKHNPGVFLFQCDTQLVLEQLETRRNAPSAICFPVDGPTLHRPAKTVLTLPSRIWSSS